MIKHPVRRVGSWRGCVVVAALLWATSAKAQPSLAGFSTSVTLDAEGAFVYLFVDGSSGARSVLLSAAGPGYASQTTARVVSDPQIEVFDPSGTRIAFNDDRADALLTDASLPTYARAAKDAALRVSLATGAYVVRVSGVGGATGAVGLDIVDSSAQPGLASFALRARNEASVTAVRLRYAGGGSMRLGTFLSGPNLPVANPMEDPRLTWNSFSVRGNIDGSFTATTDPFVMTWDELTGGSGAVAARFRSPVAGHGKNAGHWALYSLPPSMPITLNVQNQTATTNGMFLLEVHNLDNTMIRPPVVYVPPQSLTLAAGGTGVLRAIIGGDQSTDVRLEKDGVDLGPLSSGELIFVGAGTGNNGSYRFRATSSAGTAVSAAATVMVTPPPPFISASPVTTTVNAGEALVLTARVTGTGLTYQWRKDGVPIPGATSLELNFPAIQESDAGSYTLVATNAGGSVVSPPGVITVSPANPARLTNLSVRAFSGAGDRTLILGFALSGGSGASTKPVLIRGIGPGLAGFGLSGFLTDPRIGLFLGTSEIAGNNDWSGSDGRGLGAFQLVEGSRDAVLAQDLSTQTYTAQVSGQGGGEGEALVEVYDGNTANSAVRLVNVSTRTLLGEGERLIVGLTITGRATATTRLLIRAVGPTLAGFGVGSAHPDPRIELYAGSTLINENDQWRGDDGRGSGAFPLVVGSNDAALLMPLAPSGYSVHVLGARGTSGIVLVEVYEVP